MKKISLCILASLMLLIISGGCSKTGMYHITAKNTGGINLTDVTVQFDKFKHIFGIIIVGAEAGYGFAGENYPLPDKATVFWTTPDGKTHSKDVEVKSKVPSEFKNLYIYFNIDDSNNVTVTYKDEPRD